MTDNEIIGNKVRQRRLELGMTQEELAKKVGYQGRQAIMNIESGHNAIPHGKVMDFAETLGFDPRELIDISFETEQRAVDYELQMKKYPELKELNAIIKANYENPVFLSQLLSYAKFLAASCPEYINIPDKKGRKVPVRVKTISDLALETISNKEGTKKEYLIQKDKNVTQQQRAKICQTRKESNGS